MSKNSGKKNFVRRIHIGEGEDIPTWIKLTPEFVDKVEKAMPGILDAIPYAPGFVKSDKKGERR